MVKGATRIALLYFFIFFNQDPTAITLLSATLVRACPALGSSTRYATPNDWLSLVIATLCLFCPAIDIGVEGGKKRNKYFD